MFRPATSTVADDLTRVLGPRLPVAVEAFDGSRSGPVGAEVTVRLLSPAALRRMIGAPGELGFARAHVSGELDLIGDVYTALRLRDDGCAAPRPAQFAALTRLARAAGLPARLPAPPPEEARLRGRRHSRTRDAAAISHHYDVSNDFYRLVLGPTMTYSCGVWARSDVGLDAAQEAKHALVAAKLGLTRGMRLLDVGCGWGGMVIHAARHHGVRAVGVTLSREQAALARRRAAEAGVADLVEIRHADYRDVCDGPYDAVSSIGMFEHVGAAQLDEYFGRMRRLLGPGGRLLNHGISRPPGERSRFGRRSFVERYVFPDGELHEIGSVVSRLQQAGLEARHVESLREHYPLTLRAWVRNLEERWDEAVALAGPARARIWRLYMAGSALAFEAGHVQVHQTLAVRPDSGRSKMPLRPGWDARSPRAEPAAPIRPRPTVGPAADSPCPPGSSRLGVAAPGGAFVVDGAGSDRPA